MNYDLLLRGGRVMDPAQNIDGVHDVAVKDGRVAAIQPSITPSSARETVDVSGKLGTYRMVFLWQEEFSAMQFTCHYDMVLPGDTRDLVAIAMARVNAGLWLGHFDIAAENGVPRFRHTSLFRGQTQNRGNAAVQARTGCDMTATR